MTKKIVADSNYFIALYSPTDRLHQPALKLAQRIKKESQSVIISDYIFSEIVTVASQRIGLKPARVLGEQLLNNPYLELIHINQNIFNQSWIIFSKLKHKNISFTDCSIAALMEHFKIKNLVSFDRDFKILQKMHKFKLINY